MASARASISEQDCHPVVDLSGYLEYGGPGRTDEFIDGHDRDGRGGREGETDAQSIGQRGEVVVLVGQGLVVDEVGQDHSLK